MRSLAIIPARGGSKRIPKKNIKPFLGKPIIAYSIQAAISSGLFDEVMVSTDSAEIAGIAEAYGAKVPFLRSASASDDYATIASVVLEVIAQYEAMGYCPSLICCIFATAPFVTAEKLRMGYEKLINSDFTSVFPAVKFSYPIQRALMVNPESDKVRMVDPGKLTARSQDLEDYYHDSGQFYWAQTDTIKREQTFFSADAGIIELRQSEVQDIDSEEDWVLAEQKFQLLQKSRVIVNR